jgi:hypothetical protein
MPRDHFICSPFCQDGFALFTVALVEASLGVGLPAFFLVSA